MPALIVHDDQRLSQRHGKTRPRCKSGDVKVKPRIATLVGLTTKNAAMQYLPWVLLRCDHSAPMLLEIVPVEPGSCGVGSNQPLCFD